MQEKLSSPNSSKRLFQFVKLICIIGIFPVIIGFIRGLIFEIAKLEPLFSKSLYWGIASYLLLHIFLIEPLKFYKKTQRFIQVIFGFFSPLFKVSYYIIPFWVIILIVIYLIFNKILKFEQGNFLFFFLSSFFFSMHIVCVAKILKVDELRKIIDYLFIIFVIIIINIFFFSLNLKLYHSEFSVVQVGRQGIDSGLKLAGAVFEQLFVPEVR